MFNLIVTALYDIVTSLQLSSWLEFMSLFTVIMLLGSPGTIATIIGAGTKLGVFLHIREEQDPVNS